MPKNAGTRVQIVTELAETFFVIWTPLALFQLRTLLRLRVPVHTVILLVAHPVLLNELANRHFVDIVLMQEVTLVTLLAGITQPVNAHLLLALLVTNLVLVRKHVCLQLVIAHLLVIACRKCLLVIVGHTFCNL